jgi:hypothetical protein
MGPNAQLPAAARLSEIYLAKHAKHPDPFFYKLTSSYKGPLWPRSERPKEPELHHTLPRV